MSVDTEKVREFMEISGLPRPAAVRVLEINDFNLEQAIYYHLENAEDEGYVASHSRSIETASASNESSTLESDSSDNIRAPIPAIREQILLPGEDNFQFRKRRAGSAFEVCPFRDFRREAEIQEEKLRGLLQEEQSKLLPSSNGDRSSSIRPSKRSRLEDLYRPPLELLFSGTFQTSRDFATSKNRWLLVNLQDISSFKSQLVNRDIWKDNEVASLVKKYFILWQVSSDNEEGFRFKTFYHVSSLPYICIIDPRTGEEKLQCNCEKSDLLVSQLQEFLITNSFELETTDSSTNTAGPSRLSMLTLGSELELKSKKNNTNHIPMIELSEEEQLNLAIQNSIQESKDKNSSGNVSEEEEDLSFDVLKIKKSDVSSSEDYREYLGEKSDSITRMQVHLPDERRVKLEWPCTSTLRAIKLYIRSIYPDVKTSAYKLIIPYSRQDVFEMEDRMTLKEAKMYPSVTMHLHKDD